MLRSLVPADVTLHHSCNIRIHSVYLCLLHTLPCSNLLHAVDDKYYAKYWHLIDQLVQQVVLQQSDGTDPDVTLLRIDINSLLQE